MSEQIQSQRSSTPTKRSPTVRPAKKPLLEIQPPSAEEQRVILMQTAETLLAAPAPDELWGLVLAATRRILAAERAAVFLYEEHIATCPAADGLSETYITEICQQTEVAPSHSLWQAQEPLIINDVENDGRTAPVRQVMQAEGFRAYAIFPLITAETTLLGALIAYRDQPRPFSPDDVAAGQTLAHMTAMTLRNMQLLAETRLSLIREQQLNEITRTLASALDLPTILGHVLGMTANIVGADAGLLGLVIDQQVMTFYPYNIPTNIVLRPAPRGRGVAWEVAQSGETLHIPQYAAHYLAQEKWVAIGVTTLLAVPITAAESCLGALVLFNLERSPKQFTPRQIALVESIARQAGISIQHARMYAEANQRTAALRNALTRQAELDDLKNQFIQNVSHELRTPLGIIHGHAELLALGALGELESRQRESVEIITRRVRMLIDLVNDLTAMLAAETQELRREIINPTHLLVSMLDEYRLQAHQVGVALKAEIAEDVPAIKGDLTHLRRLVDNLVSNALKFTPPEGTVTLRLWREANGVIMEVADTGVGIPEEQLSRVFERFFQVDGKATRRQGGTGLGLALVKEIAEAHRGEVSVTSELGVGTTFRIVLPVAEREDVIGDR
jgi:signal transduction histidine kinase